MDNENRTIVYPETDANFDLNEYTLENYERLRWVSMRVP